MQGLVRRSESFPNSTPPQSNGFSLSSNTINDNLQFRSDQNDRPPFLNKVPPHLLSPTSPVSYQGQVPTTGLSPNPIHHHQGQLPSTGLRPNPIHQGQVPAAGLRPNLIHQGQVPATGLRHPIHQGQVPVTGFSPSHMPLGEFSCTQNTNVPVISKDYNCNMSR